MGGDVWGGGLWVKKVKGLRSTNWQLQNSHRDVKHSIQSIVYNIIITTCGARGLLDLFGESLCKVDKRLTTMLYT